MSNLLNDFWVVEAWFNKKGSLRSGIVAGKGELINFGIELNEVGSIDLTKSTNLERLPEDIDQLQWSLSDDPKITASPDREVEGSKEEQSELLHIREKYRHTLEEVITDSRLRSTAKEIVLNNVDLLIRSIQINLNFERDLIRVFPNRLEVDLHSRFDLLQRSVLRPFPSTD